MVNNWEKLCEMVGIQPYESYNNEFYGSREDYLEFFEALYPQSTAKIREELEEMVFDHEGILKYEPFDNLDSNTITWIINDDYEGVDRTEALSELILDIDWTEEEKQEIKRIIESDIG